MAKGQSSFEWVDSVLVRSILQGEWVVFENANLCNPSILDRLNSLLEEGNQSLCINEQGLVGNNELRVVTSHPNFRPIFLISKQTLVDQGKDVSRALRNRCLQVDVLYQPKSPGMGEQEAEEGRSAVIEQSQSRCEQLASLQNFRVFDVYHETLKYDMFPVVNDLGSSELNMGDVKLGKRPRSEADELPAQLDQGMSDMLETYIFIYLQTMTTNSREVALFQPLVTKAEH
jgi:hypothetical protein